MAVEAGKPFQLLGGNAALDLVNTVDYRFRDGGSEDLLATYEDLLRFLEQSGVLPREDSQRLKRLNQRRGEGRRVLNCVKELRETLANVAYAWLSGKKATAAHIGVLEKHFRHASVKRELRAAENRLVWSWPSRNDLHLPLWLLAQQTEELLVSDRTEMLRQCAREECRWLFLDTSKNHTRRWCDMKLCGNRMKARRFHSRNSGPA